MYLARSSPTVLTWFMDASSSGLQRPHSGTPRPPGASTPSQPCAVPSGPVHQDGGMGSWGHGLRDFRQMQAHRLRIASRQDQGRTLTLLRADRPKDVDRVRSLVVRSAGSGSPSGPAAGDLVLLAHARLVLPPQL